MNFFISRTFHQATAVVAFLSAMAISACNDSQPPQTIGQGPALRARLHRTFTDHSAEGREVTFSPDAKILATSNVDGTVRLIRISDGQLLRTLTHPLGVTSISFSPDGKLLASASYDAIVRIWVVNDGTMLRTLAGHEGTVWSVAFDPDGQTIASGGDDSSIRLWSVPDGKLVNTLTAGTDHVYSVAFSPDGEWLASGGRGQGAAATFWKQIAGYGLSAKGTTVRLWRTGDGTLQQVLSEHSDDVWSVAFSPDGKWLASSSLDKTVTLWQLEVVRSDSPH